MKPVLKDINILAIGQALTGTVISMLITVSSLSGAHLAPKPSLSTLPVATMVIGTLVMVYPASWVMKVMGRRSGFLIEAGLGILGGLTCSFALYTTQFIVLLIGTSILGAFMAFGQYYRFAALDTTTSPKEHTKALAIVQGAGVVGGISGPFLSNHTANFFANIPYAGAFLAIALVATSLAITQFFLTASLGLQKERLKQDKPTRITPKKIITKDFLYASIICMVAYSTMVVSLNAVPLAIKHSHLTLSDTSIILQTHFVLMFLPSFFIPFIVSRIGLRGLIFAGIVLDTIAFILPLCPEQTFTLYVIELGLSGLGWCFLFNGGTLLLTKTYEVNVKDKAQGINSLLVYCGNIFASFSSGFLFFNYGWGVVNLLCLPLLFLSLLILLQKNVKHLAK